jgi:hypothetical protein
MVARQGGMTRARTWVGEGELSGHKIAFADGRNHNWFSYFLMRF